MKDSAYKISLDIHEHASQAVLKAKKTDTGRKLHITLRAGGTPYTIEDDCYAVFKAKKSDGTILFNACTIENNEIIYEFTEQTCTAVGRCRCEIALYGPDDKLITSPRFALLVDGTIYPDELVESTDEFSALTELITDTLEATDAATQAAKNANETATNLVRIVKNAMAVGQVEGVSISLDDAVELGFVGCRIFGKSTQDGTPTPEAPVDIASVGDSGSITVEVIGNNQSQSLTFASPNGLFGIPVTSGGNYTDANGQQWICDEIDFARGVLITRVAAETISGAHTFKETEDWAGRFVCDRFIGKNCKSGTAYAMSNFAKWRPWGTSDNGETCFAISVRNLYYTPATTMTADEVTALFAEMIASETPPVIISQLETPIETPLSEDELAAYDALHTYRDNTTVTNDAGAYMELEYVMDAKKYIDSLIAGNVPQSTGTILPATVE